jgi:hypothetical protein
MIYANKKNLISILCLPKHVFSSLSFLYYFVIKNYGFCFVRIEIVNAIIKNIISNTIG